MEKTDIEILMKSISKNAESLFLSKYEKELNCFIVVCCFIANNQAQVWLEVHNSGDNSSKSFERILPEKFLCEAPTLFRALNDLLCLVMDN